MQIHNMLPAKLCTLSSFLHDSCNEYETIANNIREKNARMSVRSVALKARQYYIELNAQLRTLRVVCAVNRKSIKEEIKSKFIADKYSRDKKIIKKCCDAERYFIKAYHSILKESLPHAGLKDMLIYQQQGIKDVFAQLKLLHSVMPSEKAVMIPVY